MAAPMSHKDASTTTPCTGPPPSPQVIEFGDICLDLLTRRLMVGGIDRQLSPKEFPLMYTLASRLGECASRAQLCAAMSSACGDASLENQLYRLRKKLIGTGYRIVAERGRGHRLEQAKG